MWTRKLQSSQKLDFWRTLGTLAAVRSSRKKQQWWVECWSCMAMARRWWATSQFIGDYNLAASARQPGETQYAICNLLLQCVIYYLLFTLQMNMQCMYNIRARNLRDFVWCKSHEREAKPWQVLLVFKNERGKTSKALPPLHPTESHLVRRQWYDSPWHSPWDKGSVLRPPPQLCTTLTPLTHCAGLCALLHCTLWAHLCPPLCKVGCDQPTATPQGVSGQR